MTIFLSIMLLIMPWVIIPVAGIQDQMRLPQLVFLAFIFMGMIYLYFQNGAKYIYKNKYLAWLIGWLFIHISWYFFVPYGIDRIGAGRMLNLTVMEPMIFIILGLFATYIACSTFDKEDFVRIAQVLCLSSSLLACYSILQFIGLDPFGAIAVYRCGNRVSGCLDNPNVVANYLVLCSPLFFMFNQKKYLLGAFLTFVGIGVTKSHFGIGLAILGLFVFALLYYWRNWKVFYSICTLGLICLVGLSRLNFNHLLDGRWQCWLESIKILKVSPLIGQGLGIFKTFKMYLGTTYWLYAHNDWLERAIEIGIIGIGLMALVIINAIRNFNFDNRINFSYFSMFIIFIVMMLGSFPFETATIAMLGLVSFWAVERC